MFFIGAQIGLIGEAHDQPDIKAVVHDWALTGERLAHAEMLDFMDLFLEHFSRVNRLGAVSRIAWFFEPNENDMLDLALGSRFAAHGTSGARGEKAEGSESKDGDGFLHGDD